MAERTINTDLERYPVMIKPDMKETFKHLVFWVSMKNNFKENEKDCEVFLNTFSVQKEDSEGNKVFDSEGNPVMEIPDSKKDAWETLINQGVIYQNEQADHEQYLIDKMMKGEGNYLLNDENNRLTYQDLNVINLLGNVNAYSFKGEANYGTWFIYTEIVNSKGQREKVKVDRFHGFTALSNTVERYCYSLAEETKEAQKQALYKANKALNGFLAYNFTFDNTESGKKWNLQPSGLFENYKLLVNLKKSNIMDKLVLGSSFRPKHNTDGKNKYSYSKSLFWKNLITWIYTEITEGSKNFSQDYKIPSPEICGTDVSDDFIAWAGTEDKKGKKQDSTNK